MLYFLRYKRLFQKKESGNRASLANEYPLFSQSMAKSVAKSNRRKDGLLACALLH